MPAARTPRRRRTGAGGPAPARGRRSSTRPPRWRADGADEVVAALAVGARTSRTTRSPATAARRRPARASAAAAADGVVHRRRPRAPGATPANAAATSAAGLADGDDGPEVVGARRRAPPRSRPLLRPPAISTTEAKPRDRGAGWRGARWPSSRRTSARRPASPTSSTRWGSPRKARSAVADAVERRRRRATAVAAAASALAHVVGEGAGQLVDARRATSPVGEHEPVAVDAVVGAGASRPKVTVRAPRRRELRHHDRVVGVGDGDAVGPPGRPRCGPWPPRRPSSECVDVEVVGREVEPGADRRARSAAVWPRRNDDASTTNTSTVGSSIAATSGTSVLPHGHRAHARRPRASSVTSVGDRRLAVGAGDGDAAGGRPTRAARSNSRQHRARRRSARGGEHRVAVGHAGARAARRRRRPTQRRAASLVDGRLDERDAELDRPSARAVGGGMVVDHRRPSRRGAAAPRATAWPVTPKPDDERPRRRRGVNRARPGCGRSRRRRGRARARCTAPARIQKRMMTVVSGQPPSSKWWWIGAMRKTRRPKSRKLPTWRITDTVSITNSAADDRQQQAACWCVSARHGQRRRRWRASRCRP